jgi:hypothetical protein
MAFSKSLKNSGIAVAALIALPMILPGIGFQGTSFQNKAAAPLQKAVAPRDNPQLTPTPFNGDVAGYNTADSVMNAARQKARETLPRFIAMINEQAHGTYSLKFPLTQNGKTEHIWLQVFTFRDGSFKGLLANTPVEGDAYKLGDAMTVK